MASGWQRDESMCGKVRGKKEKYHNSKPYGSGNRWHGAKSKDGNVEKNDKTFFNDLQYLKETSSRFSEGFEDEDDREIFVTNVLESLKTDIFVLCCDPVGSSILEKIVLYTNVVNVRNLLPGFDENIRKICLHTAASHVLEALIFQVAKLIRKEDVSELKEWLAKIGLFLVNNCHDFIFHTYASHVMKVFLESIVGCHELSKKYLENEKFSDSECLLKFRKIIKEFYERVKGIENSYDLLMESTSSSFLQTLVVAAHRCDESLSNKLNRLLLERATSLGLDKREQLPLMYTDASTSALVEKILSHCIASTQDEAVQDITDYIVNLAKHRIANYVLQKLISACKKPDLVGVIFELLKDNFKEILESNCHGVITAFAKACVMHKTKQKQFLQALLSAFSCSESNADLIFPLLATLQLTASYNPDEFRKYKLKLPGSLILQQILQFNRPGLVVNSLLKMSTLDLICVATDKIGSHIFDVFFESQFVGKKNKSKLISLLKGHFVNIACDKFGSRFLDTAWHAVTIDERVGIATELCKEISKLHADRFGKFCVTKYALKTFHTRPEEWKSGQDRKVKAKNMFNDILK